MPPHLRVPRSSVTARQLATKQGTVLARGTPMTRYKLTYFDAAASRGEECRLALHLAGLPFEDERLNRDQWAARKESTPFGALPVLTVDGRQLAQSNAILRFIGSQHGLHPAEPFEAALHESVLCAVEDLRTRMQPI